MMELFNWKAVQEGLAAGIREVLPNGGLLMRLKISEIPKLKKLGVKSTVSRHNMLKSHPQLVQALIDQNIKLYVFGLGPPPNISELYVACHLRGKTFGIYADSWSFDETINCTDI